LGGQTIYGIHGGHHLQPSGREFRAYTYTGFCLPAIFLSIVNSASYHRNYPFPLVWESEHLGARPHTIRTVFPSLGPHTKICLSFSLYKHQNWGLKLMIRSAKGGPTIAGPAGLGSNTCVLYVLIITEYHALPLLGNHALVCPWLINIMTVFIAHECGQHH